eukprot:TRINITY_DN25168_c0_g1_i1.p3 TRINITY_DN25168_c0_g1~~TRINITY_DN25168_c0_g1_i1.p3  ORF type:complete len:157 (+),score=15.54 TRINITY_DN25168_c0_g1_i1:192-662(+)
MGAPTARRICNGVARIGQSPWAPPWGAAGQRVAVIEHCRWTPRAVFVLRPADAATAWFRAPEAPLAPDDDRPVRTDNRSAGILRRAAAALRRRLAPAHQWGDDRAELLWRLWDHLRVSGAVLGPEAHTVFVAGLRRLGAHALAEHAIRDRRFRLGR